MATQTLSFSVAPVQSDAELRAACSVRSIAYGHHLPSLANAFLAPDGIDATPHATVLLARDKATGAPVGTARIQTTVHGGLLPIETCIDLPAAHAQHGRAEITRLSAVAGADPLVKIALWKASYLYCLASQVKWLLIGARSTSLARQYQRLGAVDIHADGAMVPLDYAGGLPHRVLAFDVIAAERNWFNTSHALFAFMFETVHADIRVFRAAPQRQPSEAAFAA